jgi:hypothetical protein
MSVSKSRPKCTSTIFCQNKYITGASSPKILRYFSNFQKLPKVNNRPMGENSPNLVTLLATTIATTSASQIASNRVRLAPTTIWLLNK